MLLLAFSLLLFIVAVMGVILTLSGMVKGWEEQQLLHRSKLPSSSNGKTRDVEFSSKADFKTQIENWYKTGLQKLRSANYGQIFSNIRSRGVEIFLSVQSFGLKFLSEIKLTIAKSKSNVKNLTSNADFDRVKSNIRSKKTGTLNENESDFRQEKSQPALLKSEKDNGENIYEDLENQLLEKLQINLDDFVSWEALGDLYRENMEIFKAREVYNYIIDNAEDALLKIRIRQKIGKMGGLKDKNKET